MSQQYRIALIGGGLIGGSISLALSRLNIEHFLIEQNPEVEKILEGKGSAFKHIDDIDVNLVIVAVPPEVNGAVIESALDRFTNALVIDTASIKEPISKQLINNKNINRFIGTHPMAGKEQSGAAFADMNLFADRVWIICPSDVNGNYIEFLSEFLSHLGSIVVQMEPFEHDRVISKISHLPQVLSSTLASLIDANSDRVDLAGQGFRDVTRIAKSNSELWSQILIGNSDNLVLDLKGIIQQLSDLLESLKNNDKQAIRNFFDQAQTQAMAFPGKHGQHKPGFASFKVRVKDEPGSLAALFHLAGNLNLNIEDVYIDHVVNRPVALVTLYVDEADLDRARKAFQLDGWQLRD